ncbi:uncharacterized protein [Haliotis asinina]|uniref:uncharacterized protein n=1 Tax=Haliotis asinina TaxID=109174 RepID=UPI0035323199
MADDEKRRVNIANGVISGLVFACGVIYSALSGVYVDSVLAGVNPVGISTVPLWSIGFAYIVPGLLGLIGTFTKSKCAYIVQMVFCILTLLVMGIFVIAALLILTTLPYVSRACGSASQSSCITSTSFYAVLYSISISMVLGWVLTLIITILGGILACRRPASQGQVMMPMSPMTLVSTTTDMQPTAYQGNMAYSDNRAYMQDTGYPDNRSYTQGSGYPDNRSYKDNSSYLDNRSYTQGSGYPDNWSYSRDTRYPDNRSYKDSMSYPDNRSYTQGSGYPDNWSYSRDTRYPDNRSYKDGSSYPDNRSYTHGSGYPDNRSYPQRSDYPASSTRDWREKY